MSSPCETDILFALTTEKDREEMSKRTPLKRLVKSLDVAGVVLFLDSEDLRLCNRAVYSR